MMPMCVVFRNVYMEHEGFGGLWSIAMSQARAPVQGAVDSEYSSGLRTPRYDQAAKRVLDMS